MDELDLKLLEHTAIRNVTKMDYKVWKELIVDKAIGECDFPDLKDLRKISKVADMYQLTDRSRTLINDALKSSDKVKEALDKYARIADAKNIKIIGRGSRYYPYIWSCLSGMPPVVFVRGDISILTDIDVYGGVSMVGSRKPGRYALYATAEFSRKLSEKKVVIVSGMALGIDRKAHESCLDAGGKTLAVVPGGCDVIYPFQNVDLYDRICAYGAVVSEMPPGQEVIKQYFPSRNRLISALSDACLIMEAGEHSGTLHTASFAAAQSRDVFVLPNSIYDENSIGGLKLLRDGAEVLIDVDTVYENILQQVEYRRDRLCFEGDLYEQQEAFDINTLRQMLKVSPERLEEAEWKELICDEISERPKNIDDICVCLGIPISFLSSLITELETEGRIADDRGKYVLTIHGR